MNTFLRNATAPKEEEEDIDLRPYEHEKAVMSAYRSLRAPPHLNTQEACNETVRITYFYWYMSLTVIRFTKCVIRGLERTKGYVPDHFKTKKICDKAVKDDQ